MKTNILGGALFLVPLAFIANVLGKAFEVSLLRVMGRGPLNLTQPQGSSPQTE